MCGGLSLRLTQPATIATSLLLPAFSSFTLTVTIAIFVIAGRPDDTVHTVILHCDPLKFQFGVMGEVIDNEAEDLTHYPDACIVVAEMQNVECAETDKS